METLYLNFNGETFGYQVCLKANNVPYGSTPKPTFLATTLTRITLEGTIDSGTTLNMQDEGHGHKLLLWPLTCKS